MSKINEGILIPEAVSQIILDGLEGIMAGDTASPAAKLMNLKLLALAESNGNTMNVDGGVVYKIDRQLRPSIISAALNAGCIPVRYYEKERIGLEVKDTAHPLKVYLSVSQKNKDNDSDVEGMSWLDRANSVGMTQDDDNIYFLGEPIIHDDVTILRENPMTATDELTQ